MATEPARNAPCPCGSGRRYKHCHGAGAGASAHAAAKAPLPPEHASAAASSDAAPPLSPSTARLDALAAHRSGELGRAEALYRRALAENPADVDVVHMLGVVQLQRLRHREALDLLWDAAERSGWSMAQVRHNLGILLGKLETREANARQAVLLDGYLALERERAATGGAGTPSVSVIVVVRGAPRDIERAFASVAAQRYPDVEIVAVVDRDDAPSQAAMRAGLGEGARALRVVENAHLPGHDAVNAGARAARGAYLAFLDVDDHYAPDRLEAMVDAIARKNLPWGFSLVADGGGTVESIDAGAGEALGSLAQRQRIDLGTPPTSFALVEHNVAIAGGNLFVERDFFLRLGGFRAFGAHADWDFALRACAHAEPVVVRRPLYVVAPAPRARVAASAEANADRERLLGDFLASALSGSGAAANMLAPQRPENRAPLLKLVFRANQGALVPPPILRALAESWRAKPPAAWSAGATGDSGAGATAVSRTALIVLGMHRSGTSALSRVLNLCGAFLPEKVKPGKLGVNPKGFWEPEAVLDLNVRLMAQLGGDWDRTGFPLPDDGSVVDEFLADAKALLAAEYGDAPTILVKDPRICLLAPLWHRALVAAGFTPKYVVPMRNPLEVARSLHARGDMTVERGLALWLDYMRAVVAFAERHPDDVTFVTYAGLLDDWRDVVRRISGRLGVELDVEARAAEVDRFLERSLRNHEADATFAALADDGQFSQVRALYRACLARCDADAAMAQVAGRRSMQVGPVSMDERRESSPASTLAFVLCIENNGILEQALMLCESVRRYGGRHRNGPILAFAPRPGLGVDAETRARLADLDVEYIDEPLNTTCTAYAPANRVFAGAYAERHATADFLAVLDSDTIWLGEPLLPDVRDADVGVRVVDAKGSATRGPGDPFEAYWTQMAALAGVPLDRLPMVDSTIGHERIRASYNAGLTVARRASGILSRCAELFGRSLELGLRPYRDAAIDIHASTGNVGRAGSEYWGSSQTAMTLAIWASTSRVLHYPDHYNVPLHLIAVDGEIDPRWLAQPPVHLHYHWMFGRRHHEIALEICARLGIADEALAWIRAHTPFADG